MLAEPREAGTPAAARARRLLTARLSALGFQVESHPFAFAPAALNGFPLFGAGLGWMVLCLLPLLLLPGAPRWAAVAAWAGLLAPLSALAAAVGTGAVPWTGGIREDANLIAVRSGPPVRRWLVAHADTKAQGHSMAGRLIAVWLCVTATLLLGLLALLRLHGPVGLPWAVLGAVLALLGGFLAGRGRLRGASPGARDNGSGLVAILAAAAEAGPGVGVLITGAEEFGLVGARALARDRPDLIRGTDVINFDTLDEVGPLFVVSHDERGRALGAELVPGLAETGLPIRPRRLALGIFVDSAPLARAGARAVTLGRLTWATLRRIHTPRDTPDGISFETAERVGRAVGRWTVEGRRSKVEGLGSGV